MSKTTRREFIKKSGFTLVTVGVSQRAFFRHLNLAANSALTQAAALSTNDNILVVIQLAGGNDGINTVIPMSGSLNATYRQRRMTLAVPQEQILPIGADAKNNQLGFHPRLAKLKTLMDQGRVVVIQSVGYASANRSHFRSMDIWHTANLDRPEATGWLGDYFDATVPSNENPLIGVYLGGTLPLGLQAETVPVPAIGDFDAYKFQTNPYYPSDANNQAQAFLTLNRELAPERTYWETISRTATDAYESSQALQSGIRNYAPDANLQYNASNPLAKAMQQVAKIIGGNLGSKILYVTLDGFDTHQGQNGQNDYGGQPLLLQWLDEAVDVFYRDMQRLGKDDKVLIMTWSEFGRKVGENGNKGTDHGASGPQFVIGAQVRGGIIGEHPSLTNVDFDDGTVYSIDFRSYYATILENWLGADALEILGGSFELLRFV